MTETPEIIDRERPGVPGHKSRLDQLEEAAREYDRVKKAKARNTWEKREQAYGTPEEIRSASRVLEASLKNALDHASEKDLRQASDESLVSQEDAVHLRRLLHGLAQSNDRDTQQRS
jgi:hypothetical protein